MLSLPLSRGVEPVRYHLPVKAPPIVDVIYSELGPRIHLFAATRGPSNDVTVVSWNKEKRRKDVRMGLTLNFRELLHYLSCYDWWW